MKGARARCCIARVIAALEIKNNNTSHKFGAPIDLRLLSRLAMLLLLPFTRGHKMFRGHVPLALFALHDAREEWATLFALVFC